MRLVSAAQMRELDRQTIECYGVPGHVLMERAGAGACSMLLKCFPHLKKKGAKAVVVAGKGNNGGDGFVVARLLRRKGIRASVVLLANRDQVEGDALRNLRAYARGRAVIREIDSLKQIDALSKEIEGAGCVVDAMLGTGLRSDVRGLYAAAIHLINGCGAPVFALDLPSGMDADSGRAMGVAIQAEATATFGFAKLGQVVHPGLEYCGQLGVVDIGIDERAIASVGADAELLARSDVSRLLPRRGPEAHKGDAGHLLIVAGSRGKSGAAILATRAGLRTGAGLVTLAAPASLKDVCAMSVYEAMSEALPDSDGLIAYDSAVVDAILVGKSAVVVGPGLGSSRAVRRLVQHLLRRERLPVVLDADALNVLAGDTTVLKRSRARLVLTPHPGEMSRLCGTDTAAVQSDRIGVTRSFAEKHECVVVLKGARTVIASADGFVWINPTGNSAMASGGMGDVLAGVIGSLMGQGLEPAEAACAGVYLHGVAGDSAVANVMPPGDGIGVLASDVIRMLPGARSECDELQD